MKEKNILDLSSVEIEEHLLKDTSYCNFKLPEYFSFKNIINDLHSKKINTNDWKEYNYLLSDVKSKKWFFDNINYHIFNNKDWEYSWRLLQLIHPVVYVGLVHLITEENNWREIVFRFYEFQKNNKIIVCSSIPIVEDIKNNHTEKQIINWFETIEQESIWLSLEYKYLFHTDIVDCYGSLYTHSIPWALHWKEDAKKRKKDEDLLWNQIDYLFQYMNYWQTNWIPQGNLVSDIVAELVLWYIDSEVEEELKPLNNKEVKILRYRDDYRIFVNNIELWKEVLKSLTKVLIKFWMRISSEKTKLNKDVILWSIKKDKIYHLLEFNFHRNYQKQLLLIKILADEYPNSWSLSKELGKFYNRIYNFNKKFNEPKILIAITVDILYKNPKIYPIWMSIIAKICSTLSNEEAIELLKYVEEKIKVLPNTEYLYLFLQRLYLNIDTNKEFPWGLNLRIHDWKYQIWNNDWLNKEFKEIMEKVDIIDHDFIENKLDYYPSKETVLLFSKNYY